jgi:uncharacterized protein
MVRPRRVLAVLAGIILILAPGAGRAVQETPIPPSPSRWVTDEAGFISAAARSQLDARLESFERSTGHQVLVYIGRTTGGVPIEDWAVRAFQAWRVGRRGLDDGLVLFVMAEDRRARIEVGYGLEGDVPDIIAGRIINDALIPRIREGDNDGAVSDAVTEILAAAGGPAAQTAEAGREGASSRPLSPLHKIFIILAVIGFIILFITHPSFALWLLFSILSGGRGGGGGGFGGGGFSGGGGRSGGGGASGSW